MKIYFASDHAGFELKNELLAFVQNAGYQTEDCGSFEYENEDDYPDFIKKASEAVSKDSENSKAIILGGSGQGEAIVANKFSGVRAVVFYGGDLNIIKLSREHNDANILSIGARFVSVNDAKDVVMLWLETSFSGEERHKRRINKIENKLSND